MDKAGFIQLESEIERILQAINIEMVAMEFAKDNKAVILRLYIDSDQGVDMELCTRTTKAVKDFIDRQNVQYDYLEVSSPGVDRVLRKDKDFLRFTGKPVKIKTNKEFNGPRTITGILLKADSNYLQVDGGEQIYDIPRQFITIARLKPEI